MATERQNYIARGWTRHETFAEILRTNPPREYYQKGDIIVLMVEFTPGGKTYCYRSKDDIYAPGDLVFVQVRGEQKAVAVTGIGYYSEQDYPFEEIHLNYVEGPATGTLAEQYQKAIDDAAQKEAEDEAVRDEARKLLDEAKAMKREAEEEQAKARAERATAREKLAEAARLRFCGHRL